MGNINIELCQLIKQAQGVRGQNQFAKQCGVSSSSLTKISTGSWNPSPKFLAKIAEKAYGGVTYEALMNAAGFLTPEQQEKSPSEDRKSSGKWINVYGEIAAGIPIEAVEDIIDQEEISAEMASHGDYIALKVRGSSMEPRIMDGDVVIIRLQAEVANGEIAAVFVNGDTVTLKQVKKENDGLWLIPINSAYKPLFYSKKECNDLPVRILGKMVELRAKF